MTLGRSSTWALLAGLCILLFGFASVGDVLGQDPVIEDRIRIDHVLNRYDRGHLLEEGSTSTVNLSVHFPRYAYDPDQSAFVEDEEDGSPPQSYLIMAPEDARRMGIDTSDLLGGGLSSADAGRVVGASPTELGENDPILSMEAKGIGVASYVVQGTYVYDPPGAHNDPAARKSKDVYHSLTLRVEAAAPKAVPPPDSYRRSISFRPSDGAPGDRFGETTAYNGQLLVVGSKRSNVAGLQDAGAVYVYDAVSQEQLARLTSPQATEEGHFGFSVAIAGDVIYVGAPGEPVQHTTRDANGVVISSTTIPRAGVVYVYTKPVRGWSDVRKHHGIILAHEPKEGDGFGQAIAVAETVRPNTPSTVIITHVLVIGHPGRDLAGHPDAGAAYAFHREAARYEELWPEEISTGYFGQPPPQGAPQNSRVGADVFMVGSNAGDLFGSDVAIASDLSTIAVGAPLAEDPGGRTSGMVHVYEWFEKWGGANPVEDLNAVTADARLTASDGFDDLQMGYSIDISGTGGTIVASGHGCMTTDCRQRGTSATDALWAGKAYVYVRSVTTNWADATETAALRAPDSKPGDLFGMHVGISRDEEIIVAGRSNSLDGHGGSAYVFAKPAQGGWFLHGHEADRYVLTRTRPGHEYDGFGQGISVHGNQFAIGQPGHVEGYHGEPNLETEIHDDTHPDPVTAGTVYLFGPRDVNRAPVQVGKLADVIISIEDSDVGRPISTPIPLARVFRDPDGDTMIFSATSSAEDVLSVSVGALDELVLTPHREGMSTVAVTATDGIASIADGFVATVRKPNNSPRSVIQLPSLHMMAGGNESRKVDLDHVGVFEDPDGDVLTYSAVSSVDSVLVVAVDGSEMTLTAGSAGRTEVTVMATDPEGASAEQSFTVTVTPHVGVEDEELPQRISLRQNYPNPFNPTTTIRYGLPAASEVRLVVYDLLGRVVEKLVEGMHPAGWHEVKFAGDRALPSGTYVYRLETPERVLMRTMILLK